jgi:REP-associated tyrosine transposase
MRRAARVVLPGCAHHITQRGNHQQDVFFCDSDRAVYVALLRHHAQKAGMRILGYCLMTNHVHLVTTPERPNSLAAGLGRLHNDYARWLHVRQGRTGHLWQNRFFSCPLSESHLAEVLRYVELNPVRAKLVRQARDWEWSSARARIEGEDPNQVIAPVDLHPTGTAWSQVLEQGWKAAEFEIRLRAATRVGRPFGDDAFLETAEQQTGRRLRPLKPGRKAQHNCAMHGESLTALPRQLATEESFCATIRI